MNTTPLHFTDFYKVGHVFQYPEGTERVYSNLTPRASRIPGVDKVVFFGLQHFLRGMGDQLDGMFFNRPKHEVVDLYRRRTEAALGPLPSYEHIANLHNLGYFPLKVKALPEGTLVPLRVPCATLINTHPEFAWVTNFIEGWLSCNIWQPCTSATIAHQYRLSLDRYAKLTGMDPGFVDYQAHDFSFRGMGCLQAAISSGMGHLLSFRGTDTMVANDYLVDSYYATDSDLGVSVPATEHSVMCAGGDENEDETYRRLIEDIYPSGIVSIVSDTWDLWRVLTVTLLKLKEKILARNGKLVIRPDSGDPGLILCGDPDSPDPNVRKGVVELLWDVFGGTLTSTGHRLLDPHIGAIYGDSITLARQDEICRRLMEKGYASQCVLGIGSYTYQYNTRDTFSFAVKSTAVVIGGKLWPIFKKPKTDDGTKNSLRGLIWVGEEGGQIIARDGVSWDEEAQGLLRTVWQDSTFRRQENIRDIRARLRAARP